MLDSDIWSGCSVSEAITDMGVAVIIKAAIITDFKSLLLLNMYYHPCIILNGLRTNTSTTPVDQCI